MILFCYCFYSDKNKELYNILKNKTINIPNMKEDKIKAFTTVYDDCQRFLDGNSKMNILTTLNVSICSFIS